MVRGEADVRHAHREETGRPGDDPDGYRAALRTAFPSERDAIERWFRELRRAAAWAGRYFVGRALPPGAAAALSTWSSGGTPGFRELVAYEEVSTPLTVEHFTAHPGGRIYGAPATPDRFRDPAFAVRTPFRGVFLAGADAASLGVVGAFMGGVLAAGAAMGALGVQKVFAAAARCERSPSTRAGTAGAT